MFPIFQHGKYRFQCQLVFSRCKLCLRYTTGNFNENPSMRALAKLLRARASDLIFASNSSKGQILRALSNWMGLFDTPERRTWPPRYRCDAPPTVLWSHTLGARSTCWVHISPEEWNDVKYIWIYSYIWTVVVAQSTTTCHYNCCKEVSLERYLDEISRRLYWYLADLLYPWDVSLIQYRSELSEPKTRVLNEPLTH